MKRKVVQKLIEQIEEEIGKSTDTEYITIEGDIITADVGCIADWMEEYKKILEKRYNMAIEALEEIQQYREIGTVEECREAVEKQNPKKPKEILRHRGGFETLHCPNCNTDYQMDNRYTITEGYCPACGKLIDSAFRNYCGNCGQAIDENLEGMEDD